MAPSGHTGPQMVDGARHREGAALGEGASAWRNLVEKTHWGGGVSAPGAGGGSVGGDPQCLDSLLPPGRRAGGYGGGACRNHSSFPQFSQPPASTSLCCLQLGFPLWGQRLALGSGRLVNRALQRGLVPCGW